MIAGLLAEADSIGADVLLSDTQIKREPQDIKDPKVFVHSPEGTNEDEEVAAGPSSPPPPKIRRMGEKKDKRQPDKIASQLLTKVLQKQEENKNDECSAYGQYVASVLRKLTELERAKTMALLNDVLMKQHVAY
ncbi:uncharacterized protein LOC124719908 [Schistocerca piceifrons]|uniref:uncharacterized protein LOC124719908 n=1 Tax=Schistocerca piceifrons TaxID=274613 RepID=UPI001F5FC3EC|nr:uncharacterized protein LOC124719908 [Schistocerca piceifrons]